ncbi:M48 family metallopeptidase [Cellulomonas composti]|uniref:M48 family metallopeptidase n=1 Tax=Cellulomonas composti TaxID=266130 RepID=UPI0011BE71C8|nr:M48 family metallopeptidase [Cellulomonas composti]
MRTTARSVTVIALVAGVYVFLLGIVVAMLALVFVMVDEDVMGTIVPMTVALFTIYGAVTAHVKLARTRAPRTLGVPLTRADAPELWGVVDELAALTESRTPDRIAVTARANAHVEWRPRLFGSRRALHVGLPLVYGLDVSELRAVLAHELGHFSRGHDRLAPLVYALRRVAMTTADEIAGPVGWLLDGYARLVLLTTAATSRRQELDADVSAAQGAGNEAAMDALRHIAVLSSAWDFYVSNYIERAARVGAAPTAPALFGGFEALLADRAHELAELRSLAPDDTHSRWDSHPSTAARLEAIGKLPTTRGVARDRRPAQALVGALQHIAEQLADLVLDDTLEPMAWDELAPHVAQAEARLGADVVFRAAARVADVERGSLATVLDLGEAERFDDLFFAVGLPTTQTAARYEDYGDDYEYGDDDEDCEDYDDEDYGDDDEDEEHVGEEADSDVDADDAPPDESSMRKSQTARLLVAVLVVALVETGAAHWESFWRDGDHLLGPDGAPLELHDLIATGVRGADGIRELRALLTLRGVDPYAVGASGPASAEGARTVGGISNVRALGADHDVLVLTTGLVFVPSPGQPRHGQQRLREIAKVPPEGLEDEFTFLPWEEVVNAGIWNVRPAVLMLTLYDGTIVDLRMSDRSKELVPGDSEHLVEICRGMRARTLAS